MAQSSTTTGNTRGPREASLRILYIVETDTPVASAHSLTNQLTLLPGFFLALFPPFLTLYSLERLLVYI